MLAKWRLDKTYKSEVETCCEGYCSVIHKCADGEVNAYIHYVFLMVGSHIDQLSIKAFLMLSSVNCNFMYPPLQIDSKKTREPALVYLLVSDC